MENACVRGVPQGIPYQSWSSLSRASNNHSMMDANKSGNPKRIIRINTITKITMIQKTFMTLTSFVYL